MKLSEQIDAAMEDDRVPTDDGGFIVRVLDLRHNNYPGKDAQGVLPVVVVGHESMSESEWRKWVRNHGTAHYGPGFTSKMLDTGIDLKEMAPTAPFGRTMRVNADRKATPHYTLDHAFGIIGAVEKWPSLYNEISENMSEREMTLREFVDQVMQLPSPREVGGGRYTTLGDILGRGGMTLPDL